MGDQREEFEAAVAKYWELKETQTSNAVASGSKAEGTSTSVRAAGHFMPIAQLIATQFLEAGFPEESIGTSGSSVTLPGYFRPTKEWDLVVAHEDVLVAAIELKALGGPSFGGNFNNRVEEALGNAIDLSHSGRANAIGREPPWIGYFFIMEDAEGSRRPTRSVKMNFALDPIWAGLSYQERFTVTAGRMVQEAHYDAVCYVVSSAEERYPREPDPAHDWLHFRASIQARIRYLKELGIPN